MKAASDVAADMSETMMRQQGDRDQSFVLVVVLWTTLLIAVIVGDIFSLARNDAELTGNHREEAELADTAMGMIILRSLRGSAEVWPLLDGIHFTLWADGREVPAKVQDELGRIDLNMAPGDLLIRLIVSKGGDRDAAEVLVDKILDWREQNARKCLNAAKADNYRATGYAYGPREGPFESVAAL